MYKNLEILNKITHKNKSVKEVKNFFYAKNLTSAPITSAEFFESCKNYPIFFAKDKDNNWFSSVILGYKENINLFVDEKGNWQKSHYIPAFVRKYPFVFIKEENKDNLFLALDKEYLSDERSDEIRKLFDDNGENTNILNKVVTFLNQFHLDSMATKEFIKQLDEWEILEERVVTINDKKEQSNISGLYVINEEKLKNLSKKKKNEINDKNAIPLITAHLISLSNIQKLTGK